MHTDTFLSAKFDNDMSIFFVDSPDQDFVLCFRNYEDSFTPSLDLNSFQQVLN